MLPDWFSADRYAKEQREKGFGADIIEGTRNLVVFDDGIVEIGDADGRLEFATRDAFKKVDVARAAIENAAELRAVAERPNDGRSLEAENVFEFVEEVDRAARGPIAFVHERENRDTATAADFEQLAGLRFYALGGIDDHQCGVDGREHPVSVFGKVFVPGSIEKVYGASRVIELQDGRADRNATLLLEFHPVGGGRALVFPVLNGAGEVNGVAVKQEFFGERGLAGVGV